MPHPFSLTIKGGTGLPLPLGVIDYYICDHLGIRQGIITFANDWYETIGWALSRGRDWDWCRKHFPELTDVIDFMEETFEVLEVEK